MMEHIRPHSYSAIAAILIGVLLVFADVVQTRAADGNDSNSIDVQLEAGLNVAVAFGWLSRDATDVTVTLKRPAGWYIRTETPPPPPKDFSGNTIWKRTQASPTSQTWKGFGFNETAPHDIAEAGTHALFEGKLDPASSGIGSATSDTFRASIASVDIDVDCIGPHTDSHWSPKNSVEEDRIEAEEPGGGLWVPVLLQGDFPEPANVTTYDFKKLSLKLAVPWGGNLDGSAPDASSPKGKLRFTIDGYGLALYYYDVLNKKNCRIISGNAIPITNATDIAPTLCFLTNDAFTDTVGITCEFLWDSPPGPSGTPDKPSRIIAKDYLRISPGPCVDYLQWKDGSSWKTITEMLIVPKGATVSFKAVPNPSSMTFPNDKPVWGGTSGATGVGDANGEKEVTFNTASTSATDYKTVIAEYRSTKKADVLVLNAEITSLSPTGDLRVGDDLTVNYTVGGFAGNTFDSVELCVYNASGVLVYRRSDLGATPGASSTTWPAAKWSESPNSGAYANPNNGPYKVRLVGKKNSVLGFSEQTINTKLVITANVTDTKGMASRPAGLADLANALKVVVAASGTSHSIPGSSITLTDITDGKHLEVSDSVLRTLADGQWKITLKDIRDEVGNFSQDKEWNIKLF